MVLAQERRPGTLVWLVISKDTAMIFRVTIALPDSLGVGAAFGQFRCEPSGHKPFAGGQRLLLEQFTTTWLLADRSTGSVPGRHSQ